MVASIRTNPTEKSELLPFDETGILADENGKSLLLADSGGRYWLDYSGAMPVGAWVRVSGRVDHACASVSHQIAGRVRRNSIEPVHSEFDESGQLIEGRDNVLLLTSSGKHYVLNDLGAFRAGQRVRVAGTLVPLRVTLFDEGDGCVLNDSIEPLGS